MRQRNERREKAPAVNQIKQTLDGHPSLVVHVIILRVPACLSRRLIRGLEW